MFGTEGGRRRQDMSSYLIHLTREGDQEQDSYDTIMAILYEGKLLSGEFGVGVSRYPDSHRSVCFTETPLGELYQLRRRRSPFGIGFHKRKAESAGARRVWYLPQDSSEAATILDMMDQSDRPVDRIWSLTPFIDLTRFRNSWDWEREWRHPGDFYFQPSDVAFLLIPEIWHEPARAYFNDAEARHSGPNYRCIYYDADWSQDDAKEAFNNFKRRLRQESRMHQ